MVEVWGGPLVETYSRMFPREVCGLVYLDPTHVRSAPEWEEYLIASGFSQDAVRPYLDNYERQFSAFVRSMPPGPRAEMEFIDIVERRHWLEHQPVHVPSGLPVSVVIHGRFEPGRWKEHPCEPRQCHDVFLRFRKTWLSPLTAGAKAPKVMVDETSGHLIHQDNAALVASEIRRVLTLGQRR